MIIDYLKTGVGSLMPWNSVFQIYSQNLDIILKSSLATSLMLNSWIFFQEGGTKCFRCAIIILTLYSHADPFKLSLLF